MRSAISESERLTVSVRFFGSITIVSPSRTAAIGPPRAASGEMWPIRIPWLTPEKLPSVISATSSARPRPGMPEMVMLTIQLQGRGLAEDVAHHDHRARLDVAGTD